VSTYYPPLAAGRELGPYLRSAMAPKHNPPLFTLQLAAARRGES